MRPYKLKPKFKVGDNVVVYCERNSNHALNGERGTIQQANRLRDSNEFVYEVSFERFTNHNIFQENLMYSRNTGG